MEISKELCSEDQSANRALNKVVDHASRGSKIVDHDALVTEKHHREKYLAGATLLSEEELRIRGEVEDDVEKTLEEEIKDQIYHLSLHLSRLYQRRMERINNTRAGNKQEKSFCEVKIIISMEGGTKVEIKETKKSASSQQKIPVRRPHVASQPEKVLAPPPRPRARKVDWVKSLRSQYNHSNMMPQETSGGIHIC